LFTRADAETKNQSIRMFTLERPLLQVLIHIRLPKSPKSGFQLPMTILYCMAADAEYGPHLQARITPLITGVGPVEAAIAVTRALSQAQAEGRLPSLVVSLGSAGSRTLEQCGVYQAVSVSYRDMDATALGFPKGATPFLDLPVTLPLPPLLPGVLGARLSTGANIVSGAAYDAIDADMVDMETYAVLRACQAFNVPLIALRGISDGAETLAHIDDWTQYLHIIDEKLAAAVDGIEAAFAADTLP
jgi:adenosylhomocysteine nucleosidase